MPVPRNAVLLITAAFAPNKRVGAKRFTFLAEVFREKGLDVQVLTLAGQADGEGDLSLPGLDEVHRTRLPLPFPITPDHLFKRIYLNLLRRFAATPDPYASWMVTGVLAGYRIIRKHRIGAVIATAPPFTSLLLGATLSRLTGARLIVDYRDPWLGFDWPATHSRRRKETVNGWLERKIVHQASALVFVSDVMRENFQRILGRHTAAPLHVITNGFHPSERVEPLTLVPGKVNLLYAGNFYGERSLNLLLRPIGDLIQEGKVSKDRLAIHVFGAIPQKDREGLEANGLANLVQEHQQVDHATILRYMKAADILFFFSGTDVSYALPFKLFDYLSVRRPILAIAPENSAVADFMKRVPCGELGVIDDPPSIKRAISRLLTRGNGYPFEGIKNFHWDVVGERYLRLIRAVLGANQTSSPILDIKKIR